MKEDVTDRIKYNDVCWELQNLLDKKFGKYKYWVSSSTYRFITIHRWLGILSWGLSEKAKIYVNDNGYGSVTVYDKKLYSLLKEWAKKNHYPEFETDFIVNNHVVMT